MLNDDELEKITKPIIEALKKLNKELGSDMKQIPQVRLMMDSSVHLDSEEIVIDDETLRQIEDYIQSYIESECEPTLLH